MVSKYPVLIRELHLDTFGHVNNATYLALFEEARWDLVTKNGYGLKQVQQNKKGPVILEVNLKFMKELKLREEITITTEMVHYKSKIGQLKQQMLKANGEVAAEAIFTFGLFDLIERKLIDPTPEWKRGIGMEI
ncbi:MAG: acyl-CoA thioesterase [Pseudobdellovibrionaceae bacterium]